MRNNLLQIHIFCFGLGKPGDKGFAAIPGREEDFKGTISTAITYANALSCPRFHFTHCMDIISGAL